MSLLKKLAGETAVYGISSILGRLLNWVILTPFLTRVFSPLTYGIYSELYIYIAFIMALATFRMETAFFRYAGKGGQLQTTFSTGSLFLLFTTSLLLLVLMLFSGSIAAWLQYPDRNWYVISVGLILFFDIMSALPFARLRLENRPIRFAELKVLGILLNLLFIIGFLRGGKWILSSGRFCHWESWYLPLDLALLANVLSSGIILLLLAPGFRKIRMHWDTALLRKMLTYAAPLVIAAVAGIINQLVGPLFIKQLASDDLSYNQQQMGIYSAAAKLAVLMNLFTQAFNYAAEPFFFRIANRSDTRSLYGQIGQAFTMVGSLAFLGITLYMDIIGLFIGQEFREGVGIVPILLLAYLFLGLFYNFSIWYKLADRTRIGGWIALGGAGITLLLNFILVPRYGFFGPAWAALACYAFMAGAAYWSGQRNYPIKYPIGRMGLYVVLALAGFGMSYWLQQVLSDQPLWVILGGNTVILLGWILSILALEGKRLRRLL